MGRVRANNSVQPGCDIVEIRVIRFSGGTFGGWHGRDRSRSRSPSDLTPPPWIQVPFTRLLALNRPEAGYIAVGIVSAGACGVVQPAFAFLISDMVATFYDTAPVSADRVQGMAARPPHS
jgi:hypothetical protein